MKNLLSKIFKGDNINKLGSSNLVTNEPSLEQPVSQLCTFNQFNSPIYAKWCKEIHEDLRYHRKQWEFVYILQILDKYGMIRDGKKGLGFGVGLEPLPALLAKKGCNILATDLAAEEAKDLGWISTNQHAHELKQLNSSGICPEDVFRKKVHFEPADMNNISSNLMKEEYDFTWSACCLEHLGDLRKGLDFIVNSLKTLKPGGVAVHTTEYNLESDSSTLEKGPTVIYRKRDMLNFSKKLKQMGFDLVLNLNPGNHQFDRYYDVPPYRDNHHLRLLLDNYISTSIGLVIYKPLI